MGILSVYTDTVGIRTTCGMSVRGTCLNQHSFSQQSDVHQEPAGMDEHISTSLHSNLRDTLTLSVPFSFQILLATNPCEIYPLYCLQIAISSINVDSVQLNVVLLEALFFLAQVSKNHTVESISPWPAPFVTRV